MLVENGWRFNRVGKGEIFLKFAEALKFLLTPLASEGRRK